PRADRIGREDVAESATRFLHDELVTVALFERLVPVFGGYERQPFITLDAANALARRSASARCLGHRSGVALLRLGEASLELQFAAVHTVTSKAFVAARVTPLRGDLEVQIALLQVASDVSVRLMWYRVPRPDISILRAPVHDFQGNRLSA